MKNLLSLLLISLLSACSGEIDDEGNLVDIDQIQQAYAANTTNNFQFGTRTAASHRQCDRTSTGQVCSVPSTKSITYCIDSGFTQADYNLVSNEIRLLDDALSGWTFTFENDLFTGACLLSTFLVIKPGSCGTSGTSPTGIENYGCATLSSTTNLTEGVNGNDPVGSYQKHSLSRGTVDITDINAKYSNASQREFAKRHAIKFILLSTVGLGSRTDGAANTFGSRSQIANFSLGLLTAGEKCRLGTFNSSNNGDFSNLVLCNTVD